MQTAQWKVHLFWFRLRKMAGKTQRSKEEERRVMRGRFMTRKDTHHAKAVVEETHGHYPNSVVSLGVQSKSMSQRRPLSRTVLVCLLAGRSPPRTPSSNQCRSSRIVGIRRCPVIRVVRLALEYPDQLAGHQRSPQRFSRRGLHLQQRVERIVRPPFPDY